MGSLNQVTEGFPTHHWQTLEDGRVECQICPRLCKLAEGQRGLCFVRGCQNGKVVLFSYGRSSGFCIDPIEKKPLNHFLPGTPVFSFGTAGCNLTCRYCQNWDISKSKEMDSLMEFASPAAIAQTAQRLHCRSVAYTYNDPVIFHEYAIDTAKMCRALGLKNVSVSAGYQNPEPRKEFYEWMDAANIDLKSFSDEFYRKVCGGHLQPVLDTLEYLKKETKVWLEITTLLVPGYNDSDSELESLSRWISEKLGPEVPLHFSAFHPDWKMRDVPPTSLESLLKARQIAKTNGLYHVYVGNVHNKESDSTYCHQCGKLLIGRDWYVLSEWNLNPEGCCVSCGSPCAGVFENRPGTWGDRRQPITFQGEL